MHDITYKFITKFLQEMLKGRGVLEGIGRDWKIILKLILNK
jgi:hypothetical protein